MVKNKNRFFYCIKFGLLIILFFLVISLSSGCAKKKPKKPDAPEATMPSDNQSTIPTSNLTNSENEKLCQKQGGV